MSIAYPTRTSITRQICQESWDSKTKLDPCHKCPIMSACHKVTPAGLEAFTRYMDNLNEAARRQSMVGLMT